MQNFLKLVLRCDLQGLLWEPTTDTVLQLFRYLFVGGIATVGDWSTLYTLSTFGCNKYIATAIAFCVGLLINYLLSKSFVFKASTAKSKHPLQEFLAYALIGVIGLCITEALIYLGTDVLAMHLMLSKIIATLITLVWNFIGRKMLYR